MLSDNQPSFARAAIVLAAAAGLLGACTGADRTPSAERRSGTAFFVSAEGHLLTSAHLVQGCDVVHLKRPDGSPADAAVVTLAVEDDLALVKAEVPSPRIAAFRAGTRVRPGEAVIVYGFPLGGLLASTGSVTPGTVAALAGVGDDPRMLQLSAPLQVGQSGAPVLDRSGSLVGLVSTRVEALATGRSVYDLPQSIGFALKASVLTDFLDAHDIHYRAATAQRERSASDIWENATEYTVRVQCDPARDRIRPVEASKPPAEAKPEEPPSAARDTEAAPAEAGVPGGAVAP